LSEGDDLAHEALMGAVGSLRRCNHHLSYLWIDGSHNHNASRKRKSLDKYN
jgi:hypothetical protein